MEVYLVEHFPGENTKTWDGALPTKYYVLAKDSREHNLRHTSEEIIYIMCMSEIFTSVRRGKLLGMCDTSKRQIEIEKNLKMCVNIST